jgi:hypothetical protein
VLDSWTPVIVNKFLDLTLSLSWSRFVDRHLDNLIEVSHDNGSESRVLSMHHGVVDRPISMEIQHLLIPLGSWFHLQIGLIANTVINVREVSGLHDVVVDFLVGMSFESGKERPCVIYVLHKSMDCVSVGLNGSNNSRAMFVLQLFWLTH